MEERHDTVQNSVLSPYTYEPLRPTTDAKQIRIVALHHGRPEDEVVISISIQDIHEDESRHRQSVHKDYEALSYTWGSSTQPRKIVKVQTGLKVAHLEIYENLYTALQTLRRSDQDRKLWIDAICINQSDTDNQARLEKSWQIPIMHEVYNAAARVIVWLGPEADDSTLALTFLEFLAKSFVFERTGPELIPQDDRSPQAVWLWNNWREVFTQDQREHQAVTAILDRPWFTRVWIHQEVFAASDSSLVMCGSAMITLRHLQKAISILSLRGFDVAHPNHEHHSAALETAASVFHGRSMIVLDTLARLRRAHCREAQDKIYGCLGMIKLAANRSTGFVETISTDYPKTAALYNHFCRQYLRFFGDIQFLYQAGLCQRSRMQGPSWMPDWTVDFERLGLGLERAVSHAMRADACFLDNGILRVKGVVTTKVTRVEILDRTGFTTGKFSPQVVDSLAKTLRNIVQPGDEERLESLARAFCTDQRRRSMLITKIELQRHDFKTFLTSVLMEGRLPLSVDLRDPHSLLAFKATLYYFQEQQVPFFSTESGHVGIGAENTRPGDLVAAVLGLNHLVLIRHTEDASKYQVVGPCFVHGFNWGEALLGPLPLHMTMVPRLDVDGWRHDACYKNEETGAITFWDPRIDWTKLTPEENKPARTMSAPRGEPRRIQPDAEFLRTYHNAKIVNIDLI